jgi:hypothetical protein
LRMKQGRYEEMRSRKGFNDENRNNKKKETKTREEKDERSLERDGVNVGRETSASAKLAGETELVEGEAHATDHPKGRRTTKALLTIITKLVDTFDLLGHPRWQLHSSSSSSSSSFSSVPVDLCAAHVKQRRHRASQLLDVLGQKLLPDLPIL